MAVLKRIEMVVLFLWMSFFCCYGQTDSVAIRTISPNEIQEKYVVESMDSITAERVEEQIVLQQFEEILAEINASCPTEIECLGNAILAILDSMSFEYPQVNYHLSLHSKDYEETKLHQLIGKYHLGLTYHISFLDKEGGTTVIYTPDEISQIYSQGLPKERVLHHLSNLLEEANKSLPTYVNSSTRFDYLAINNGFLQSHYTIFEDQSFNIKNLKKSKKAMKLSLRVDLMKGTAELYVLTTGCAILNYGFIFRFASDTKKKHLDIVFSPDEIQEIERDKLQR